MKSIEELRELYESQLKPALQSMEGQRKKILGRFIIYISAIVSTLALTVLLAEKYNFIIYAAILVVGIFAFLIYMTYQEKVEYRHQFKQSIVKEIVRLINPDWDYNFKAKISSSDYSASGLFDQHWDRYNGDDKVVGEIEKTDFQFSELHTQYKSSSSDGNGKRKEEWHTIFKGLFAHADFNKEILGRTLVLPDTAEKIFGKWGQNLQKYSGKGELIKMENPEFEKLFVVYGSNQIESRYVLTPTMMEAMINIRNKYKKNVYFSFIGSRVYVAMSFTKDLFEPRLFRSGVRFEDTEQMNEQFGLIQTIIHEMNLNTRIWTKD